MADRTSLAVTARIHLAALLALAWPGAAMCGETAPQLAGRYTVASLPSKAGATLADAAYGGVLDLATKAHTVAVTWRLTAEAHRLRGMALLDRRDLLCVSLATGGAAHGLAIYERAPDGHQWRGRWITSVDSGASPGEMSFDDGADGKLPGRHHLHCSRSGVGGFDGSVTITGAGTDYLLSFSADGMPLYRGLGILLEDGRFVVAWSFGSPPAVAVYRIGGDGLFTGRRVNFRGGLPNPVTEYLARAGEDAARLFPPAARVDSALVPPDVDASLEPDAPDVKSWTYGDLMDRYSADGWAQRWLEGQLTPEEHALLERAVHRRRSRSAKVPNPAQMTVGELIEQERQRSSSDD